MSSMLHSSVTIISISPFKFVLENESSSTKKAVGLCRKNDSLIMEQNQSSAPWLHPSHSNTDGRRTTTTIKITVRSAKKQERLKKKNMERKTKALLGVTFRRPRFDLPIHDGTQRATTLPPRWALLPPSLPQPFAPQGGSACRQVGSGRVVEGWH